MKPRKISTHSADSDNFYLHFCLIESWWIEFLYGGTLRGQYCLKARHPGRMGWIKLSAPKVLPKTFLSMKRSNLRLSIRFSLYHYCFASVSLTSILNTSLKTWLDYQILASVAPAINGAVSELHFEKLRS